MLCSKPYTLMVQSLGSRQSLVKVQGSRHAGCRLAFAEVMCSKHCRIILHCLNFTGTMKGSYLSSQNMQDMGPHADSTCVCSTLLDVMGLTQQVAFASALLFKEEALCSSFGARNQNRPQNLNARNRKSQRIARTALIVVQTPSPKPAI